MSYGIESPLPHPPVGCFTIGVAASRGGVTADELEDYAREGLLISLKSNGGIVYYTDLDCQWINTVRRLREEAHLSFEGIRHLLVSHCTCWKLRHCDFHARNECPVTTDPSKPCWVNRARWSVLVSYPCYSCIVYRSAGECEALQAVLDPAAFGKPPIDGYYGG